MREEYADDLNHFESRTAGDSNVYVKFYMHPRHDEDASAREGRPIYKEVEYIEIRTPGQQSNIVKRPVSDMDRARFRQHYRMFKEGSEEQLVGTPLTEVPWLTRSQVEELAYERIRTLEALANVSDSACNRMAGLYTLKQRAQKVVEQAANQAPILDLQKQIDELKNLVETQQSTIKDQSDVIAGLRSAKTSKSE